MEINRGIGAVIGEEFYGPENPCKWLIAKKQQSFGRGSKSKSVNGAKVHIRLSGLYGLGLKSFFS